MATARLTSTRVTTVDREVGGAAPDARPGGGGSRSGGTVRSVGLSVPSALLAVSGSPITQSGTLALTLPARAANAVLAGPATGADAAPSFRALVLADIPDLSSLYQPLDGDLTALAALAGTGLAVRTAANTWAQRTIAGTTNQVNVANGDGVAGNPTLSLPQSIHTGATPQFARLGLGAAADGTYLLNLGGSLVHGTSAGVGIGVTTPGFRLDVFNTDSTAYSSTTAPAGLRLYNPSATTGVFSGLEIAGQSSSGEYAATRIGSVIRSGFSADFVVQQRNAGTYQENFRITAGGNVGIGGTPTVRFQVFGGDAILCPDNSVAGLGGSVTNAIYKLTGSNGLGFRTNSSERVRIDSAGNVGIGTTAPSAVLQVRGAPATTSPTLGSSTGGALYLNTTSSAFGMLFGVAGDGKSWIQGQRTDGTATAYDISLQPSGGNVGIGTTSATGARLTVLDSSIQALMTDSVTNSTNKNLRFGSPHYTNAEEPFLSMFTQSQSAANILNLGGGTSVGNAATQISFFTASNNTTPTGTERVRITSSGDVGIGTTPSGAKLHVAGEIKTASEGAFTATPWKLLNYNSDAVTPDSAIHVMVDGHIFRIAAEDITFP